MSAHIPQSTPQEIKMTHPTCSYDIALPSSWFKSMLRSGFDPRGTTVWAYPTWGGCPYPLSPTTAHKILSRSAGHAAAHLEDWQVAGLDYASSFKGVTR